jgi:hypothetical protein
VREKCLKALKDRLIERANIIQVRGAGRTTLHWVLSMLSPLMLCLHAVWIWETGNARLAQPLAQCEVLPVALCVTPAEDNSLWHGPAV